MVANAVLRKYNARVDAVSSMVCVGLDPEFERIPARFLPEEFPQFALNKWVIDATAEFAAAYQAEQRVL